MDAHRHAHAAFHLTGRMDASHLAGIDGRDLVPALFAQHRDLTTLRYDYPLVLVEQPTGQFVQPLSGAIDDLLARLSGRADETRVRQHVLRLEAGIRSQVAAGSTGRLSEVWDTVAKEMATADEATTESLSLARTHLGIDGMLLDCERSAPFEVLRQAWRISFARRATEFNEVVAELTVRLEDVLKADFENSAAARSADNLKSSFGSGPMDQFDFEAMSRMLTQAKPTSSIPDSRRRRVERILDVLRAQQFYPDPSASSVTYSFIFDTCSEAISAFGERLPAAIKVAKAIAVGQLEAGGDYVEERHDPLFASFGEAGLDAADLAIFPDYLVVLSAGELTADEQDKLEQILSSGLPFKVLVQTDDVIEDSAVGKGRNALALSSHRLTSMAMGLADVYVLQAPASHLFRARENILDGLDYEGTTLFSIFSGADAQTALPAYLVAAAALEARVFPMFTFDPSAGPDWASRFSLTGNPQVDSDWPVHGFAYEDAGHQSLNEAVPFTLVDFVASDARYAQHFADAPFAEWTDHLVSVDVVVDASVRDADHVPSLHMVDSENALHKVLVDESVIREARRCGAMWASLQELGGVHNSHVEAALVEAEAHFALRLQDALDSQQPVLVKETVVLSEPSTAGVEPVEEVILEIVETRNPDEAYIETMRCSTCNECTQLNGKMFNYNENQQAFIADITAGTYAQLVEAAESCQVSVIHPGKPLDPNEPGLDDLLKRAELFL